MMWIFSPEKSDGFGWVRTRDLGYQRAACEPLDRRSRYDARTLDDKSEEKGKVQVGFDIKVRGKIAPSITVMLLQSGFEMATSPVQSSKLRSATEFFSA
jgi:hypothetical protein